MFIKVFTLLLVTLTHCTFLFYNILLRNTRGGLTKRVLAHNVDVPLLRDLLKTYMMVIIRPTSQSSGFQQVCREYRPCTVYLRLRLG